MFSFILSLFFSFIYMIIKKIMSICHFAYAKNFIEVITQHATILQNNYFLYYSTVAFHRIFYSGQCSIRYSSYSHSIRCIHIGRLSCNYIHFRNYNGCTEWADYLRKESTHTSIPGQHHKDSDCVSGNQTRGS